MTVLPRLSRLLLAAYTVVVLLITWLPAEDAGRVTGIVDTLAGLLVPLGVPFDAAYTVLEFVANVALFAPFGALLALAWSRLPWWAASLVGAGLSCVIELVQIALPSRFATVSDVVANTLGTLIGVLLVRILQRMRAAARTAEP